MKGTGRASAARCPCDSGDAYSRCCRPLHLGMAAAPTAESLMRSRYSAFVKALPAYLLDTWHPSTRPVELHLDPDLRWTGLEVRSVEGGGTGDDAGAVEFVAHHVSAAGPGELHERSRFVRIEERWSYLDGEQR